jgi:hypothetical protein
MLIWRMLTTFNSENSEEAFMHGELYERLPIFFFFYANLNNRLTPMI